MFVVESYPPAVEVVARSSLDISEISAEMVKPFKAKYNLTSAKRVSRQMPGRDQRLQR